MTRVHPVHPQRRAKRSALPEPTRAVYPKKKSFKIVLEAVTQEKKKLHSILSYASNAPNGFGFIPAGYPDFTEWCKEQCRQRNLDVHIVSAKPRNKTYTNPDKLSHHVHRVGHHFPREIINLACSKFGYVYSEQSSLRKARTHAGINWIAQRVEDYSTRQLLHGRSSTARETREYIQDAVREMFPKIPGSDLSSIVNHAFQEGTNRVGNAKELSLARRVQLAVVAHIRHVYTDYDKLLKTGGWTEARQKVESVSLAKLKEWRDEASEHSNELEETFREIIVLDDDDDDDESSDGEDVYPANGDGREPSLEIVFDRATAQDLQPERRSDHARAGANDASRTSASTIFVRPFTPQRSTITTRAPHNSSQAVYSRDPHLHTRPRSSENGLCFARERAAKSRTRPIESLPASRSNKSLLRDIDGQLYHLQPFEHSDTHRSTEYHSSQSCIASRNRRKGYVQSLPRISSDRSPYSRRNSGQDTVIPSVEHEIMHPTSPQHGGGIQRHFRVPESISQGYVEVQSPRQKPCPLLRHNRDVCREQSLQRAKPIYAEDELRQQAHAYQNSAHRFADAHDRPRMPLSTCVIDLTRSPQRVPTGSDGDGLLHPYPPFEASDRVYAAESSRRFLLDEKMSVPEASAAGSFQPYVPGHRPYERRAPPGRGEYGSMRHEDRGPGF